MAPQRTPRVKTAPLWVFTPPVAANIVRSAPWPARLSAENVLAGGWSAVSWPSCTQLAQ